MSILDFFKRNNNHAEKKVEFETEQSAYNIPKVSTKAMVYGVPKTIDSKNSDNIGSLPNPKITTLDEYYEGCKNLKKLEKLYQSTSEINSEPIGTDTIWTVKGLQASSDKPLLKENIDKEKEINKIGIESILENIKNDLNKLLLRVERLETIHIAIVPKLLGTTSIPKELILPKNQEYSKLEDYSTGENYIYNTTNAILDILTKNQKELHLKEIFDKIKNYKLKNQYVSYNTVKSTIYSLVKKKKIRHGLQYGCFQILKSSKNT